MSPSAASRLPLDLSVGEVARRSGVAVSTIHFYEAEGLIEGWRTAANHRRYPRGVLRRIAHHQGRPARRHPAEGDRRSARRAAQRGGAERGGLGAAFGPLEERSRRSHRPADTAARRVVRLHRLRLPVAQCVPLAQSRRCAGGGRPWAAHPRSNGVSGPKPQSSGRKDRPINQPHQSRQPNAMIPHDACAAVFYYCLSTRARNGGVSGRKTQIPAISRVSPFRLPRAA